MTYKSICWISDNSKFNLSILDNAIWAAGEIALHDQSLEVFILPAFQRLATLIEKENTRNVSENAAITICRYGYNYTSLVSQHLDHIIQPICSIIAGIRDNLEKESAFLGLLKLAAFNPDSIQRNLVFFCHVCLSWTKMAPAINGYVHGVNLIINMHNNFI